MRNMNSDFFNIETPMGLMEFQITTFGIKRARFLPGPTANNFHSPRKDPLCEKLSDQINGYFEKSRHKFELTLDFTDVPEFQMKVLLFTKEIRWGEVLSYQEVAWRIDRPNAVRAVANSLAHNPLLLLVPCHRVIGSDRKMHGFASPNGINTKVWLLQHEGHQFENEKIIFDMKQGKIL